MTVAVSYGDVVREWEARPLLRGLGLTVAELDRGYARLELELNSTNATGVRDSINGGVQATVAEIAAHLVATTLLGAGEYIAGTQDVSIAYLTSARAAVTLVEARVLRHGRLTVVDIDLGPRGEEDGGGQLNAKARVTCALGRR